MHKKEEITVKSKETYKDQTLTEEADRLADEAALAYANKDGETGQKLFIEALSMNSERSTQYRFRQALDLFLRFRSYDPLYTDLHIEELITHRYEPGSFERTALGRNLLVHGFHMDDYPLVDVAQRLIDDEQMIASTLVRTARSERCDKTAIGHLNHARVVLDAVKKDKRNKRSLTQKRQLIENEIISRKS